MTTYDETTDLPIEHHQAPDDIDKATPEVPLGSGITIQAIFPMGDFAKGRPMAYPTFTTDTAIPDGFAPLCTKVQSDKLLAEQAHRYRQDLSRLGDERDALVAQHDRDAETIAELRKERDEWKDAAQEAITNSFKLTRGKLGAANHESTFDAALRVVAERDEARSMLKLAEGVAAALPDPDAQNPEHCQFAAELSAQLPPTGPNEDWEWTTAHRGLTARQWAERAKSLEAAQSAEAQRDREIEAVAKAFDQAVESDVTDRDAAIAAIDALDAARAEAGQ